MRRTTDSQAHIGSLYMAPEILRYEKYDAKADLWSVGAVLFEMSVGKPPFRAQNHVDLLRRIERGEDRIKFPDEKRVDDTVPLAEQKVPTQVASDVKAIIRRLLKRHPSERMSFDDFFREAAAVAQSGSASGFAPAEVVSARVAANARASPPSTRSSPIVPPDSVAAEHTTTRRDASSPLAPQGAFAPAPSPIPRAASRASPPLAALAPRAVRPPPSPSPAAAAAPAPASGPSPTLPAAQAPTSRFAPPDTDPPPFARRPSAVPSPSPPLLAQGAGAVRRASSFAVGQAGTVQRVGLGVGNVAAGGGSGTGSGTAGSGTASGAAGGAAGIVRRSR